MPEIRIDPPDDLPGTESVANPLTSILADLKISGQLPGEGAVIAIVNAISAGRANMSDPNRDRWDALQIKIAEDTYAVWRGLWERAGVLPKEDK